MVLNASYVCLLPSRCIENHLIWILKDGPSFLRWFCHMNATNNYIEPKLI
jgi:hypothetical protein